MKSTPEQNREKNLFSPQEFFKDKSKQGLNKKGQRQIEELKEGDAVMQPLFYEQVDHHIEEVGIMAIKQVKYVTEKQWQKMIEMQKDNKQIWKYLQSISRYEKRFEIANRIPRNNKGQFSSQTTKNKPEKTQQIKKRGRPRKDKQAGKQE